MARNNAHDYFGNPEPDYTCSTIDAAIDAMEEVRRVNVELREWGGNIAESAQSEIDDLNSEIEKQDNEIEDLENTISDLRSEISDLKAKLANKEKELMHV